MISYVPPACLVPRTGYRERKRELLIAPVPGVFELQSDLQEDRSDAQEYACPGELDIAQMQAQALTSRMKFDMEFEQAYQEIETNSQNGGDYFGIGY